MGARCRQISADVAWRQVLMAVVKVTHPAVGVRGGDRAPSGERIRTHAAGFKKPQTQMLSAQEPPAKGMPPPGLAGTCGPGPTDGSGTRPAGTAWVAAAAAPWVLLIVLAEPCRHSSSGVVTGWAFLGPFPAHPGALHAEARRLPPPSLPPEARPGPSSAQAQGTVTYLALPYPTAAVPGGAQPRSASCKGP